MIKKLHDVIWNITGTSWTEERLSEVLESLEEAGMKPPFTDKPSVIGRDRNGKPAAFDIGRFNYLRPVWECEDDELAQLREKLADDTWQEPED